MRHNTLQRCAWWASGQSTCALISRYYLGWNDARSPKLWHRSINRLRRLAVHLTAWMGHSQCDLHCTCLLPVAGRIFCRLGMGAAYGIRRFGCCAMIVGTTFECLAGTCTPVALFQKLRCATSTTVEAPPFRRVHDYFNCMRSPPGLRPMSASVASKYMGVTFLWYPM